MSKLLAVFGATGNQGTSVIQNVLKDAELSNQYKIRAITRDSTSAKAKRLVDQGIEVVKGDLQDPASIEAALEGVHTVYLVTIPSFGPEGPDEEATASRVADVAVKQGAQYFIFSTLPNVTEISGGKYTKVLPFDAKARAEEYIRGLPIKSAFLSLGYFMENFHNMPFLQPKKQADGSWALLRHTPADNEWPFLAAVEDTGKFANAILAEPDKYAGKTFCASENVYTTEETAAIWSKASGKQIAYKQITAEEFKSTVPFGADAFDEVYRYGAEFGYFGPQTKELVAWAAGNARGRLTTLEEYLKANPIALE